MMDGVLKMILIQQSIGFVINYQPMKIEGMLN
jgi:hypothetical protein